MNIRMKHNLWTAAFTALALMLAGPAVRDISAAAPVDSGAVCTSVTDTTSTDGNGHTCLGAFNPAVNTTVTLPPDGILDYSSYTVPYGVTVTFVKNANNTPVVIRSFGNILIEGTISVSCALAPTSSGTYGDGILGDDGQPGLGGPGGFDGGYGGLAALFGGANYQPGGSGKGPGGGQVGSGTPCGQAYNGAGGGFGTGGGNAWCAGGGGATYGQATLLPLIGGSGGSGGGSGSSFNGAGGGGGGGAILISAGTASAPATITIGTTANSNGGRIYANGCNGGHSSGSGCGGCGGGGSGGAIRLVADTLACPNSWCWMEAYGGSGPGDCYGNGGNGGKGIIRLEYNNITGWNTGRTDPQYSWGFPGHIFVPNNPTLMITSVTPTSGSPVAVPANPTGNADITFPEGTTTATVNLSATYIPIGTTVTVYVVPASGANRSSALSSALSGADIAATTASASVTLSPGNNVLMAAATYTVTELIAMNLPTFDNGVRVAKIRVESTMGGASKVIYITANGKEYPADSPLRDAPSKAKAAAKESKS